MLLRAIFYVRRRFFFVTHLGHTLFHDSTPIIQSRSEFDSSDDGCKPVIKTEVVDGGHCVLISSTLTTYCASTILHHLSFLSVASNGFSPAFQNMSAYFFLLCSSIQTSIVIGELKLTRGTGNREDSKMKIL